MPLFGVYSDDAMASVANTVIRSGQIATGSFVGQFESALGQLIKLPNIVSVSDLSSAIKIALQLSGVGRDDEVLTTSYACLSTNAPITSLGARPSWVDVNPLSGAMDPDCLEQAITARTKAVILYHVAGYPAESARIAQICRRHNLKLIEDCNAALLSTFDNQQVGAHGDFAAFSFYPNRQINATEGGALSCRSDSDARNAVLLRRFGIDTARFRGGNGEINAHCDIPQIGWAATLNNLCSAIGYAQIDSVLDRVAKARQNASLLRGYLADVPGLKIVQPVENTDPSYWVFLVHTQHRDAILLSLRNVGIFSSQLHIRTDLYSGFGTPDVQLPGTDVFMSTILALPCGWWLNATAIEELATRIRQALDTSNC
jgi:dTDP-4-amino-4,6-dideoxygalactose transaminase